MFNILIVEDQKLLRESFKTIIENNSDIKVAACASNGREAFTLCEEHPIDVVLMDLYMPVCDGIEATRLIKEKYPEIRILILTSSEEKNDVAQAIQNGADGFVVKNMGVKELILAIQSTWHGMEIIHKSVFDPCVVVQSNDQGNETVIQTSAPETSLSSREISIIKMIVEGKNNKEIALTLYLAEGTVKNIITEIISKLQLKDRTQLAVFAIRNQLV